MVETLALAHGVEARAQLGQAAYPALRLLLRGRHQVQVLAAALEGDGEAARWLKGATKAPQALGLVTLADSLDVLHEDCGEGWPQPAGQRWRARWALSPPRHCQARRCPLVPTHICAAMVRGGSAAGTICSRRPLAAGTAAPSATCASGSCTAGSLAAWRGRPHPRSGLRGGRPGGTFLVEHSPITGFDLGLGVPLRPHWEGPVTGLSSLPRSNI